MYVVSLDKVALDDLIGHCEIIHVTGDRASTLIELIARNNI